MKICKVILMIVLLSGIEFNSYAQSMVVEPPKMKELKEEDMQDNLIPKRHKTGLWGYVNSKKKFVVKPKFENALPFEGNVARVCHNGKWGIMGRNGLYILNPTFIDSLYEFSADSIAIFSAYENGMNKHGLINSNGWICQGLNYASIIIKPFGYLAKDYINKYTTIDKNGNIMLAKEFDNVLPLEDPSMDIFFNGAKWGIIRDGKEIITQGWDKQPQLLYDKEGNIPDLYLVSRHNLYGVIAANGKQVTPIYYDSIKLHESGNYFITMRDGKYGALSLSMKDIVPPILDKEPLLEDKLYRVYNGFDFMCASMNGSVEFRTCSYIYSEKNPDEYISTTDYPEWAKEDIIMKNLADYKEGQNKARNVYEMSVKRNYDANYLKHDPLLKQNIRMSYAYNDTERYGLLRSCNFIDGAGLYNGQPSMQRVSNSIDNNVCLVFDRSDDKHYIIYKESRFSLNDALDKFNIKSVPSLYLKDYTILPDGRLMVRVVFVRTKETAYDSLIETESYNLPVSNSRVNIFSGTPNATLEAYGIITFDPRNSSAISFAQLPSNNGMAVSAFGGFYTRASSNVVADANNYLRRYDRFGNLEWTFKANANEVLVDMDETENYLYLCGYVKNGSVEQPLLIQLDKSGNRTNTKIMENMNGRISAMKCANYLIYAMMSGSDSYLPHFILEDLGDNMYVRPCCAWEDWGGKMIGGCGLIGENGKWIQTPVLEGEEKSDYPLYGWSFGSFNGEYLIISHDGKYGVINRNGDIVVNLKYELLEQLDNPNYFRFSMNGKFGVVDATGRIIVPAKYDYIGRMSEDMIVAKQGRAYGSFDAEGVLVVPFEFLEIKEFVGGMARILGTNNLYGFVDKKGHILVQPNFDAVEYYSEGLAMMKLTNAVGYFDMKQWVVRPIYDAGKSFSGGLAPVCLNNKWGYIDKAGKEKIGFNYDSAEEFNQEYRVARVSKGGKWGVINDKGTIIVPISFDEIVICVDGYIYAKKLGDKSAIYSHKGAVITSECDDTCNFNANSVMFKNGVAEVKLNGKKVKLDKFGKVIYNYTGR